MLLYHLLYLIVWYILSNMGDFLLDSYVLASLFSQVNPGQTLFQKIMVNFF